MFSRLATCLVLFVVCINLFNFDIKVHTLLYPPTTVYQMIGSVSIAISGLPKTRKAFVDWGFQMNYQMPFNLSEFYMVPIWSTGTNNMQKRQVRYRTDFTANELYEGLEDLLESYGFHRSCLARSMCELAQQPFDDRFKNILTDSLTFLLTPSLHQEFSSLTGNYKNSTYNQMNLFSNGADRNCSFLYQNCTINLLNLITKY